MWRFIMALMAFALVFAVIKMVIIALVIAGLIFRTKETIGLLIFGGISNLIIAYPAVGWSLLVVFIVLGVTKLAKSSKEDADQAALDHDLDDPAQE